MLLLLEVQLLYDQVDIREDEDATPKDLYSVELDPSDEDIKCESDHDLHVQCHSAPTSLHDVVQAIDSDTGDGIGDHNGCKDHL